MISGTTNENVQLLAFDSGIFGTEFRPVTRGEGLTVHELGKFPCGLLAALCVSVLLAGSDG